jgi:hypothetical protein
MILSLEEFDKEEKATGVPNILRLWRVKEFGKQATYHISCV